MAAMAKNKIHKLWRKQAWRAQSANIVAALSAAGVA